ncbi:orotate phosphoribosyltransferase [bacterium BMS3Bbin11]|nr:orotate phosphoribosyltransferase [bacterium BMS3Abin11]GBE45944.1 orotate phosphoribosyltransferase [bacterium BMS3Bbin11]HDH08448.1 orotate phosphoribosyltransferase [Gammaproteobacteria bacterium]HDH16707.1 orotate phosphoribosyltransferase [Gammaproteobacteria bacterium]HDZ78219.1 orotate phosphoribosyltransferase [Gammaproteobacteria bacterium]
MQDFRREFLDFAIQSGVLRFGQFTLKSGRNSPYFFNTGLFNSGNGLAQLGRFYARAIIQSGIKFDMLFGPAYKGIPIAAATVIALSDYHGLDIPYAFDRKETKDHGEGGNIVGAPLQGQVLIIDDVITAGLSAAYSIKLIRESKADAAGFVIALDRQEKTADSDTSALQLLQQEQNLPVFSIATLEDLVELLQQESEKSDILSEIEAYREVYGC